jgi:putative ABC transport system permease protein
MIIGVVDNVRQLALSGPPEPTFYAPQSQNTTRYFRLLLRGDGDTLALAAEARRLARAVDPALPVAEMRSLQSVLDQFLLPQRGLAAVLFILGTGGMLLAAFGIYGLMSYLVLQRTREIGVRMALGASRGSVFALILRRSGTLALCGIGGGIVGGVALSRLLSVFLGQANPDDPLAFGAVSAILVVVTLAASAAPVQRAVTIEPVVALRHE